MTAAETSEQRASPDSFHAEVLHALIHGAPGSTTEELQELYDAIAPLVYRGMTETAVTRRWRREVLASLQEDRQVIGYKTPSGWVWIPLEEPGRELRPDGGQVGDEDTDLDGFAAEAWREVGHEAVWLLFMNAQGDVDDALAPIETALCDDRPVDETAVRDARRRLDYLRHTLEEYIAPLADGVGPWDDGAGATTPYSVMREQLEARGYTVEKPGD